jgi:uncharacterized protein YndB with AHSA1/START domain
MKTLTFSTVINANRRAVWDTMLAPGTYKTWTSAFMEGSYYEGSWEKGERIRFLGPGNEGMLAVIAENQPHEFISIKHIGMIKNGVEDTESDEARSWAPAFENYFLKETGSSTELTVTIDVPEEFVDDMGGAWPAALAKLKTICEAPSA